MASALGEEESAEGEVIKIEFTTSPIGVVYEKGEGLRVKISGRDMCLIEAAQRESSG